MLDDAFSPEELDRRLSDLDFPDEPSGLYIPVRHTLALGGKRIRPRLCLMAYGLFSDLPPASSVLEPAWGLEVFHTFTLVHDDIMDRSSLRRGKQTVWKRWGEDTAILSGDVLCIDAYRRIALAPAPLLPEVLGLFSDTARQVCEGQQLDMEFEQAGREVDMAQYMDMIGKKTAALIACSAAMGAALGGADAVCRKTLYDYGYYLGLAFQVADDYLDTFGDTSVFGKPIGGDILNGKKTWLTLRALEKGTDADRATLRTLLESPAETCAEKARKIAAVKAIYDALGVAEDTRREMVRLEGESLSQLGKLASFAPASPSDARRREAGIHALEDFARELAHRTK